MVSVDEFLPCLIYVIVKAKAVNMGVYLQIIDTFTLTKRQTKFDFARTNTEAALDFIMNQLRFLVNQDDNKNDLATKQRAYN